MTRIQALALDQTTPAARAQLEAAKQKLGMVPNLFSTLAQSPAALDGYMKLSEAVSHGSLTGAQREQIALSVGQANKCGYCVSAHTLLGKGAGLSAEQSTAARQGEGSSAATLARQLIESRGEVSDAQIAAARAAGLTDGQLVEVAVNVALNVLTNYVNNLAHTKIDFPVVAL